MEEKNDLEKVDTNTEEKIEQESDTIDEDNGDEEYEDKDEEVDPDEDEDLQFDYDEEGNIIIPDDDESGDDGESDSDDKDDDDDGDPAEHEEPVKPKAEKKEEEDPSEAKKEDTSEEKYKALAAQAKELLKKLGVEADDPLEGLIQASAESEGVTKEEYKKRLTAEENVRMSDLKAIQEIFPHAKEYKRIEDLPNLKRFAELRVKGATAIEAYRATHSEQIAAGGTPRAKGSKEHLTTTKPSRKGSIKISSRDMKWLRESFPNKTDKERLALYKKTL